MYFKSLAKIQKGNSEGFSGQKTVFGEESNWAFLYEAAKKGEILQGIVSGFEEHNLNGIKTDSLVVFIDDIKGVIINDEIGEPKPKHLGALIGAPIAFKIKQCIRANNLVYLSRKDALEEMSGYTWEELKRSSSKLLLVQEEMNSLKGNANEELDAETKQKLKELSTKARQVGPIRTATVRNVIKEGAFVDIGGVSAFLPAYEMSWGRVDDAREVVKPGESFDVKVNRLDFDNAYIRVSLKALLSDPWEKIDRYQKGAIYSGVVKRISYNGRVIIELQPGVFASCRPLPMQVPEIGKEVKVRLDNINKEKRFMFGTITGTSKWAVI